MNNQLKQATEPPRDHSSSYPFDSVSEDLVCKKPAQYDLCECGSWKVKVSQRCLICYNAKRRQGVIDGFETRPMYRGYDRCECGVWKHKDAIRCRDCRTALSKPKDVNDIFIIGDDICRYIPTTRGQYLIVDEEEYEKLSQVAWSAAKGSTSHGKERKVYRISTWIVNGSGKRTRISIQNFLMPPLPRGLVYDHSNRNPLDNRKSNLRPATIEENSANQGPNPRNTSGYRGVGKSKNRKRFIAQLAGKFLGTFDTAEEAARAYDKEARARWGKFAPLNFPDEWPDE